MSKKIEYTILLMFTLLLLAVFLWQMYDKEIEFKDLTPHNTINQETEDLSCVEDKDCIIDATVIHCPTEVRCELKKCVTYCVYDDVENSNLFQVSDCLDDIKPLSVRDNEYNLHWQAEDELNVSFNIVLACSIQGLSGYYELAADNKLALYYEYAVPELTEPCLCVRKLTYRVPHMNQQIDYEIIINKIEK